MTRVESFCEKRDSSRVTFFLNVTRVESLTRVTLSLASISNYFCALVLFACACDMDHEPAAK